MTNLGRWRFYLKDIESPERFIDWSFYSMIAGCLQRRVWYASDTFQLFPNLFVLLVGPPAAGKSRVISQVGAIIQDPSMIVINKTTHEEEPRFPFGADTTTQEAIIKELATVTKTIMRRCEISEKMIPYSSSPMFFVLEELATLLRRNTGDTVNMLNQLYDSRNYTYKTKHMGNDLVRNVCVNILGGTTPNFIQEAFSSEIMSQGFTSRVILVYAPGARFYRQFPGVSAEQKEAQKEIIIHCKRLHDLPVVGQVRFSPEAAAWHKDLYESGKLIDDRVNTDYRLDDYYGRKNVHLYKLAMAVHFADSIDMTVQLSSLQTAFKLLAETEKDMHRCYVSQGVGSPSAIAEMVYRKIHGAASPGLKKVDLETLFYVNNLELSELPKVLKLLLDRKLIEVYAPEPITVAYYRAVNWQKKLTQGGVL